MAWARLVFYPGGTQAQYEAVIGEIGEAHRQPPGRSYYAAGPAEGGWMMFMVWDSQDTFQRWAARHIGPAHERAGARGWRSDPVVTDFTPGHVLA
ncbi:MAG TPA: hypothetical protein VF015_03545 [Acidimicrobiales bacterium]